MFRSGLIPVLFFLLWFCALLLSYGCTSGGNAEVGQERHLTRENTAELFDKPLDRMQVALLDLAFECASKIPVYPHIKDRSKTQELVVQTCLELDQPKRALAYMERIDDWRRGACRADLAYYLAEKGLMSLVQQHLEVAERIAEATDDWRRDTIRVKIAKTHALIGNREKASEFEEGVVESETGKVVAVLAGKESEDTFTEQANQLESLVSTGSFDLVKNALEGWTQIFDHYYHDVPKRERAERAVKNSWEKIPIFIRVELLTAMAKTALEHQDPAKALSLADEAQQFVESHQWRLEHRIPLVAPLITIWHQAGDHEKACQTAETLRSLYDQESTGIVNIYRAGALRPLAENYALVGDATSAVSLYARAVEEGIANPNSRPRAEDLSATCASMAKCTVAPSANLWTRIREIYEGLGDPW